MKDRILAPEKLAQRDKAIKHNADAIEQLRAQAKRGQSLHPQLMAEQAQRYRQAVAYADMANQKAQEAVKRGNEAIAQAREVAKQLQDLQTQYSAKSDQVKRLDADIDRLRKMRDRENGPSR
jgi:predicted nuclease with TOPRIM domain